MTLLKMCDRLGSFDVVLTKVLNSYSSLVVEFLFNN
jgi:hypothetical protein